jgi:hypothetical protein
VCIRPCITPAVIAALTPVARRDFIRQFGLLRHETSPRLLRLFTLGIDYLFYELVDQGWHDDTRNPYRPEGPWTWLPPIGPQDWRTRASITVSKRRDDETSRPILDTPTQLGELVIALAARPPSRPGPYELHVVYDIPTTF